MRHVKNVKKRNGVSFAYSTTENVKTFVRKGFILSHFKYYIQATNVLISTVNSNLRLSSLIKEFRHLKYVLKNLNEPKKWLRKQLFV